MGSSNGDDGASPSNTIKGTPPSSPGITRRSQVEIGDGIIAALKDAAIQTSDGGSVTALNKGTTMTSNGHLRSMEFGRVPIPASLSASERLRGIENYPVWEARVINRLRQVGLDGYALGETASPRMEVATDAFHIADRVALGYIADQLVDDILAMSSHCQSASAIWSHLCDE
jgi:hypothetical protein